MRVRLAALLLALAPCAAAAVDLVGKTMPPYPDGLQDTGGICLSDSTDAAHVCDFSIGFLGEPGDDPGLAPVVRHVVAGRMKGRDGAKAIWSITDAVPYPEVPSGYFWQAGSCRVGKADDGKVVAIVRQSGHGEYLSDVAWARRLDLETGRFEVVDPARVDCVNEGYGEDP